MVAVTYILVINQNRRDVFVKSVIKSARSGTQIEGLFYQNDIESLHALENGTGKFKKQDVLEAVDTLKKLYERENNDECMAIFGSGNYVLVPAYSPFKVDAETWHHTWSPSQREEHMKRFRQYVPNAYAYFNKPLNAGRKPGERASR